MPWFLVMGNRESGSFALSGAGHGWGWASGGGWGDVGAGASGWISEGREATSAGWLSLWAGRKGRAASGKLWLQKGDLVLSQQTLGPLGPPSPNKPAVSFLFILCWEA